MFKSWLALKGQFVPPRGCWQISLLCSRQSLMAVQLACLDSDVVLRAPVEMAALVGCWSCDSCLVAGDLRLLLQLPGRWRLSATMSVAWSQ